MFDPDNYPITIVEVTAVQRELEEVLSEEERERLIDWLAMNPSFGDIIPSTNGVRKTRWSYGNRGKRGGLRVIYYFRDLNMPVYVLAVYKKNEKMNLTMREKQMIAKMVDQLVDHWAQKRERVIARCVR
jgi:mRNA-degrading endonuclease RelE of RelBE toxin-antitoxin system